MAGALLTGTHGSGKNLKNLSSMLVGGRVVVTATGTIREFSLSEDPEFTRAARASPGTLGIFTALRLRLLPAYKLHRQEGCTPLNRCRDHQEELVAGNRNFDFYWYPRSDRVKFKNHGPAG